MAAFRLATKGKTMADASYEPEVKALQQFLKMQKPVTSPSIALQASVSVSTSMGREYIYIYIYVSNVRLCK